MKLIKKSADLCQQNIIFNNFKANIFIGDVTTNIKELKSKSFDHVFMNPPFFKKNSVIQSPTPSSRQAKVERVALSEWIFSCKKRCKPKGLVTIIQRVERLPEIIKYLNGDFGQITVQPISSFKDTSPKTVIVQAKKVLVPPLNC